MKKIDLNNTDFKVPMDEEEKVVKAELEKHFGLDLSDQRLTFTVGTQGSLIDAIYLHTEEEIEKAMEALTSSQRAAMLQNAYDGCEIDDQENFALIIEDNLPIEESDKEMFRGWFVSLVFAAESILRNEDEAKRAEERKHA